MKGFLTVLLLLGFVFLYSISIYEIQYTNNPGRDNTYPSRYVGKTVTVEGIVTATNYKNDGFFISESAGGPWRSIYIKTSNTGVKPGDKIVLKGTVDEYFGMTTIQDVIGISIKDSHHAIPFPNQVTSGQLTTPDQAEAYESTLVKVQNSTYVQNHGGSLKYTINDGSGSCIIGDNFISEKMTRYKTGQLFSSITGIVCYAFGEYSINPRNQTDISVLVPVFNQNRSWGRIKSIYK